MLKTSRAALLPLITLAGVAACKRHAPAPAAAKLELRALADARADRVAEIVIPAFDRTLGSVGALTKKMSLPFGEAELRQMMMARNELPPGVLDKADLSKPAAVVLIAKKKEKEDDSPIDAVLTFALKDASPAGFDAFAARAGKVAEKQKDAVRLQPGDGGGKGSWMLPRDGAVCVAETLSSLVNGCALALEARQPLQQDLRVTVVPEGIARASGTTLKAALDKTRAQIGAVQAQMQATNPAGNPKLQASGTKMIDAVTGWIFDAVTDTSEARLGLAVDAAKGLTTAIEVVPRPGSGLAKTISDRHAYALDPALATGQAPASLFALGDMTLVRALFAAIRTPLLELIPSEADRVKAGTMVDELFAALAGPMSGRFSFEESDKAPFAYDVVYQLKPGVDGKKLLGDLEQMLKAPWMNQLFAAAFSDLVKVKLTTKREGDALLTQVSLDLKKLSPKARAEIKAMPAYSMLLSKPFEGRTAVAGDRMIVTSGEGSKARLAALTSPTNAAPAGDLQAALAETKGADGLYYADLAAMLRPIIAAAGGSRGGGFDPLAMAGPLLANARLATWGTYRGGATATVDWRIPTSTFETVGAIIRNAMGGGAH